MEVEATDWREVHGNAVYGRSIRSRDQRTGLEHRDRSGGLHLGYRALVVALHEDPDAIASALEGVAHVRGARFCQDDSSFAAHELLARWHQTEYGAIERLLGSGTDFTLDDARVEYTGSVLVRYPDPVLDDSGDLVGRVRVLRPSTVPAYAVHRVIKPLDVALRQHKNYLVH